MPSEIAAAASLAISKGLPCRGASALSWLIARRSFSACMARCSTAASLAISKGLPCRGASALSWLIARRKSFSACMARCSTAFEGLWREIAERLAAFHSENPDLPGMGIERLRLAVAPKLLAVAFRQMMQSRARRKSPPRRRLGASAQSRDAPVRGGRGALAANRAAANGKGAIPAAAGARSRYDDRHPGERGSARSEAGRAHGRRL